MITTPQRCKHGSPPMVYCLDCQSERSVYPYLMESISTDDEFRRCSSCSRPKLCNYASECYIAFRNRGMQNAWVTSTSTQRTTEELVDELYAEGQKLGAYHYNLLTEAADRLYEMKRRLERKPWWRVW